MSLSVKTLLVSSLLLASATAFADDEKRTRFYVGVGVGSGGSGEREITVNDSAIFKSDYDTSLADLKLGAEFRSGHRFELAFTGIDLEYADGTEDELSGLDFDWYFAFGEKRVKPYLMVGLGLYTFENTAYFLADNEDLRGVAFNLGGGIFIEVAEPFEVELGYKFKGIGWQKVEDTDGDTLELSESMGNLYLGARLKF